MLRTVPVARSGLARALMMALIGVSAILGLVGMHAFHPESHLQHPSTAAVAVPVDAGLTHAGAQSAAAGEAPHHGVGQQGTTPADVGCGDCGMGGGHAMVMVLCLLTLLVSAAVILWPPLRRLLHHERSLRLLYQQLGTRWPTLLAPLRPPSLQVLSISRR